MLRRFLERQSRPAMEPPAGPPLTEADLKAGLLREVDLFSGLTSAELKEISRTLPMQTCHAGGPVTSPDDEAERLYVVKRGRVRLYRLTPDGSSRTWLGSYAAATGVGRSRGPVTATSPYRSSPLESRTR